MGGPRVLVCALLLGGCGGSGPVEPGPAPAVASSAPAPAPSGGAAPHLAIVTDRSDSVERKDGAACNAVRTVVEQALFRPAGSLFAPGARLEGFRLEAGASSVDVTATAPVDAPRVPAAVYAGVTKKVTITMETPPEVAKRQMEKANEAMVAEVGTACRQVASQQGISPIFDAVKAAASRLTNVCTSDAATCLLVVQSDWVETAEPAIKKAVDALRKDPKAGTAGPLPTIDLQKHITLLACGSGQSSERMSNASRDAIRALWRDQVFVGARAWVEQDQCPGYVANPELAAGG